MSEETKFSELKELEWINIPGVDYIMKYKFSEDGYSILVTNLKEIFGEIIYENEVQRRFSDLNVHAKMKTNVIIKNLERSLEMVFSGNDSILKLECFEKNLKIFVQFSANKAALCFNFEPQLLSMDHLRLHILVPTLSHVLLTYQENISLKKKINKLEEKLKLESVSKDPLIDYKKNVTAINLICNSNISETDIIGSYLNVQRDIKTCFVDRKKAIELQRSNLPESSIKSQTPIKKEVAESSLPIKYEDKEEDPCPALLQLPAKRDISESLAQIPIKEETISPANSQTTSVSNFERSKKKKTFKF